MSLALVRDLAQAGVRVVCCEGEDQPAPLGFASKYPAERVTLPRSGELDGLYRLCGRLTREEGECWEAPTPPDGPEQRRPADFRALMQRLREKK